MPSRIVFNVRAFAQIRTSDGVVDHIANIAEEIAEAAGEGFVAEHRENPSSRARSSVLAVTREAQERNARDNVLITTLARFK